MEKLGVPYLYSAHKPAAKRIRKFLQENQLEAKDCLFAGDQLLTDARYVRKLGGRFLLTEPLGKKEPYVTKLFRWYDRLKRKRYLKQGRLGVPAPTRKEENHVLP